MQNYSKIVSEYSDGLGTLANDIPGPVKAFGDLVGTATEDNALSKKVKELIAFASRSQCGATGASPPMQTQSTKRAQPVRKSPR